MIDQGVAAARSAWKRAASGVLMVFGGILALSVPFLPWSRGISRGAGSFAYNAFDLAKLDVVDLRIVAYLTMGVGSLGVVAGCLILGGWYRFGVPGAVLASGSALVLTMVVVASYAFAQFLGLGLPALLGSNPSYSSPPAILALGLSTAFMLVGAALSFKTSRRRTQRRDW